MWWLRHPCTLLLVCVLYLSSTSGSQVRNGNSYVAFSIVTTSQPANSNLGEFDLTDFVPAIPPQPAALREGFAQDFPLTVSKTTGKTIASVYTPVPGPWTFAVGNESVLSGTLQIPGTLIRVPLTLLIHARDTPTLPTTTLNVSLSELYSTGVTINFSVSYPATTVNVRLAHNSSLLVNTSITINNTLANVKWARPPSGMSTPESSIALDLAITDNAKGRSVLQMVQIAGLPPSNFTAPRNGASREKLILNVRYPVCNASSLMAQDNLSSNSIFFTIMNKPTLLKVSFRCSLGYEEVGQSELLCTDDGVFTPRNPPTCRRVVCPVPTMACPNARLVSNSSTYQYESRRDIVCESGHRAVSKNGSSVCEANRTSSIVCPKCEAIPCDMTSLEDILPPNIDINRFSRNGITNLTNSVTVHCETGYNRTGDGKYQCLLGARWSNSSTTCKIVDCGTPPVVDNSNYTFQYTTYKELANYSCVTSYERKSGDESLRCSANGSWVGSRVDCLATTPCRVSLLLANLPPSNVASNTSIATVAVNGITQLQCRAGYTSPVPIFANCQLGGVWDIDDFNCTPVVCPLPPPIEFGNVIAASRLFLSWANVSCDNGYQLVGDASHQICSFDGKWRPLEISCKLRESPAAFSDGFSNPYYLLLFLLLVTIIVISLTASTAIGLRIMIRGVRRQPPRVVPESVIRSRFQVHSNIKPEE